MWLGLRRYPAALVLYALGIGAVEADRLGFLRHLMETPIREEHHDDKGAVEVLPPSYLVDGGRRAMHLLEGMEKCQVPLNDWMHKTLRPHAARVIPDDTRYTFVFDKLEVLVALGYLDRLDDCFPPIGAFGYREDNRKRIIREIQESLSAREDDSPFVKCGVFGNTAEVCTQRVARLQQCLSTAQWY